MEATIDLGFGTTLQLVAVEVLEVDGLRIEAVKLTRRPARPT
jgi:hypothetical protein